MLQLVLFQLFFQELNLVLAVQQFTLQLIIFFYQFIYSLIAFFLLSLHYPKAFLSPIFSILQLTNLVFQNDFQFFILLMLEKSKIKL